MRRTIFYIAFILIAIQVNAFPVGTMVFKDGEGNLVLKNEKVELVFSGGESFLFKEFRMDGNSILSKSGSATFPWQLEYIGPNGENPILTPQWAIYKGGVIEKNPNSSSLIFTWQMVLDGGPTCPVREIVSLSDTTDLPEWRIEAELPKGWVITELEFPRISVSRHSDSKAVLPVGYGTEYSIGPESQLQSRYPSCTGGMQLVLMHDKSGTVYFSSQDKKGSGKIFKMKSEGENVIFIQSVTASYGWTQNGKFTLPWATVMGYSKENWQNTVIKWYRPFTFQTEWGKKTIPERTIVKWVQNSDMWLRPMHVKPETMDGIRKAFAYFGKGMGLHWYYWHHYLMDTKYPEYFPPQDGFKEMIAETQKLGGYVTPYTNGRLWDPATDSYRTLHGKDASCRKADGTLYTEVYGSKVLNTVTCPSSEIWRNVLRNLNRDILTQLGTNGVYMDQIGCATSEPCYAANHPHALGGGDWWPTSYRTLLTQMRKDLYREDQAMTTEENAECYIDLFDMMLVVNSPHNSYTKMVPLFPLVYSDRCIYSGYTYIPWNITDGSLRFMTMRSLLWGSQIGWVDPYGIMNPSAHLEAEFLKNLKTFRHKQHDLFLGGRFIQEIVPEGDNPTINIPNYEVTHAVLGAEWLSVSGKKVYLFVNMSDKDHVIVTPGNRSVTVKALDVIRILN